MDSWCWFNRGASVFCNSIDMSPSFLVLMQRLLKLVKDHMDAKEPFQATRDFGRMKEQFRARRARLSNCHDENVRNEV